MFPEHKYSLPAGIHLRQYRIVRLLGHGGFGLTYLADDTNLNRKVAIKELLPIDFAIREADGTTVVARTERDKINLEWCRQRFLDEGRTLAALHHPSILHVYDIFELHGTAYLVTDFIEGSTFEDWLRKAGALRQEDLVSLTSSLLDALQLVHEQGYLHRDIKPENILMDEKTSRPVLIDFGNARVAAGVKTATLTAVLTRGYAPFEQYQTKARQGPFTDLYALGAVLYRAIKGVPPDDALDRLGENKIQVLSQQRIPGYTPEFLATIDKALQMRREDRWQKCGEWKAALGVPDQPLRQSRGPNRKRSKVGFTMAALGMLAVAGLGIGIWIHHQLEEDKHRFSMSDSSNTANTSPNSSLAPVFSPIVAPSPRPAVSTPLRSPPPAPPLPGVTPELATVRDPFTNSLEMKFVPVEITGGPTNGKRVLFSIWDTRVQDYAAYAGANEVDDAWKKPKLDFEQGPTHPVVNVSWEDAKSFCEWLTAHEQAAGRLPAQWRYRLPSDHEWSCAVGIGRQENATKSPASKNGKIENVYHWGTQWPPPKGAGNYAQTLQVDDFEHTSPVGSFAANKSGLYDMGGNVWQWCEDWFDSARLGRVLRGGSWNEDLLLHLQSTSRLFVLPRIRRHDDGFRCVLVVSGG